VIRKSLRIRETSYLTVIYGAIHDHYKRIPVGWQIVIRKCFYHARALINVIYWEYARRLLANVAWFINRNKKIRNINLYEQKFYSQNGEDGIIEMIFRKIGTTNKFLVEFGVGDGFECNTRYLIEKGGWRYLHMDCEDHGETYTQVKKEFITAENVNQVFRKYDVPEEFDLLSIDVDYNTYWIWDALERFRPRVVIIEYNATIPPNESKVVKYDPYRVWDGTNYIGASLLALVKLGKKKGYTLIGCESNGINAFFLRNDLVSENFVVRPIEKLYKPYRYWYFKDGQLFTCPPSSNEEFLSI